MAHSTIFHSNMKNCLVAFVGILFVASIIGCGSPDAGTPSNEKIDVAAAQNKQQGVNGVKAQHGGGIDEGPIPAPPGVKTGAPGAGAKSGG